MSSLNVVNSKGRKFKVCVIDTGDRYGLNNCLVNYGDPMVEFWDMFTFPDEGQFVSRYYVDTILEDDGDGVSGLNLDNGEPVWSIDASTMLEVVNFLKGVK